VEQWEYVRIFQKAGANLLALINDILDLSKVESGRFELESIGFDLGALLQKIIEMMDSPAQDRGLQLILEILPGVPLGLIGDPNRLRQILVNLIGNALKFTSRGSVTLRVEPDPAGAAGWLRFSVVDTGIGIATDKTEMIFDRFTQADSSTTREYGGTGLGLAISKGLVELMGGRMGCTSEKGKGSTFFLEAPFDLYKVTEASASAQPVNLAIPPAEAARKHPVFRVLIAEDSEDNLVLIKAYLKDYGFELDVAENGKVAVEKVVSSHPQLVLMDVQMPVMDGLQATRAIRKWEQRIHAHPMPIFALTAHATGDAVARSREAGCTEHLTKPIKKAVLLEAIFRHISGQIGVTPPGRVESLAPNYLAQVRRDVARILGAVDAKDCILPRQLGQHFKRTGENYGFPEITRTGAMLELAAMASNEDEIRSQILALSTYLDRVEVAV
jgi:CheY-like chemotaxis protein